MSMTTVILHHDYEMVMFEANVAQVSHMRMRVYDPVSKSTAGRSTEDAVSAGRFRRLTADNVPHRSRGYRERPTADLHESHSL